MNLSAWRQLALRGPCEPPASALAAAALRGAEPASALGATEIVRYEYQSTFQRVGELETIDRTNLEDWEFQDYEMLPYASPPNWQKPRGPYDDGACYMLVHWRRQKPTTTT